MSNFPFISNSILQENLDNAFQHVLDLLILINSGDYDKISRNSFRKSTIICTASIIEALLFVLLKNNLSEKDLEIPIWKIKDEKFYMKSTKNIKL